MKNYLAILIILCLSNVTLFGQDSNAKSRIIKVDYNKSAGDMNTMFKECI